jgi:hypothetical protein
MFKYIAESRQLLFGDMILGYHKKIRPQIAFFHCRYQRARHSEIHFLKNQILVQSFILRFSIKFVKSQIWFSVMQL